MGTYFASLDAFTIRPGDFVFFRTFSLAGRVITHLQVENFGNDWMSDTTHVAFCVGSPEILREALLPRTQLTYARAPRRGRQVTAVLRPSYLGEEQFEILSKTILQEALQKSLSVNSRWYSVPQIIGFLYMTEMAHHFGVKFKRNPIRGGTICTEECLQYKIDMEKWFGIKDPINEPMRKHRDSIFPYEFLSAGTTSTCYDTYRFNSASIVT